MILRYGSLKAYVGWNDYTKTHYYEVFEIFNRVPEIGDEIDNSTVVDIKNVELDCEQANDDVYNYDFYELTLKEDDDYTYRMYVCVEKEDEQYED